MELMNLPSSFVVSLSLQNRKQKNQSKGCSGFEIG
jgi:hypothetical protein